MTSNGPERPVLLSADEYQRLKAQDRVALFPWGLDPNDLRALAVAEPPPEAAQFDAELPSR